MTNSAGRSYFDPETKKRSLALRGELVAPKGKFRLVGVDTFEGPTADFLVGDFELKADVIKEAENRARKYFQPYYVYDDTGEMIFSAGTP